ncbi:DUF3306 domain-containing protein [Vibrio panuliri]|uniref:DUF3306 domain-containing protein n=1 Tax=Vibrio panuliri TaxID=1381081 RepID=UPI000A7AFDD2|nr:DUF3306 domain-containing protein [Vibrio panuliri]KAB1454379.1 DUF3306 domain-containing protein [Vibrio panuliri]
MVTSFISRWSKRKLDEKAKELLSAEETQVNDKAAENSDDITKDVSGAIDESQQAITASETQSDTTVAADADKPEEMSIANLLVSEAEQSVKKAALRKLFLSEEFNVRDGLDDYDEDYSNLKTLSQSVAETLRDWVKEQPEETAEKEQAVAVASEAENADTQDNVVEQDASAEDEAQFAANETQDSELSGDADIVNEKGTDEGDETKYTTQ